MDSLDLTIVNTLATNGRITFSELAELVGLSGPSTAERVRKLEERGVIRGYEARLDADALGMGLSAFVAVALSAPADRREFLSAVAGIEGIVECHHVAGDDDYLLKVHVDGTGGLERLVSYGLKSIPGVTRTRTTVVLSSPMERALRPAAVAAADA